MFQTGEIVLYRLILARVSEIQKENGSVRYLLTSLESMTVPTRSRPKTDWGICRHYRMKQRSARCFRIWHPIPVSASPATPLIDAARPYWNRMR